MRWKGRLVTQKDIEADQANLEEHQMKIRDKTVSRTIVRVIQVSKHERVLEDTIQTWLDKGWAFQGTVDGVQSAGVSSTIPAPILICIFTRES